MLASDHFKIERKADDDWFDAILNADTKLFIDPFLVFKEKQGRWVSAHHKIISHFDRVFLMIAKSNFNADSLVFKKAIALLIFEEPKELCLGYAATGTKGAGGGDKYAKTIAAAIIDAIKRGLDHPKHFEELGVLNKGIGSDRISDIAATILKEDLIAYTQDVAKRHDIPLTKHRVYASAFDDLRQRWGVDEVNVPTNPFSEKAFLFVPQRFIRELPTLNATEWWNSYENERLREDVNYEIMGKVDKVTIVAAAREHPEMVRRWMEDREKEPAASYDLARDPKGVWQWDSTTLRFAQQNPLTLAPPTTSAAFFAVVEMVVDQFQLFVEQQGGWDLLWNGAKDKPEESAQLLFRGIVYHYCAANNINVDREVELGRGPVDFKFSNGYSNRAHLEVKKLHNGKFWNGLDDQLTTYMKADALTDGWFLALRYRNGKAADKRAKELSPRVAAAAAKHSVQLRYRVVDARKPLSASKI